MNQTNMSVKDRRLTKGNLLTVDQAMGKRKSVDEGREAPAPQTTHASMMRRASRFDPRLLQITQERRMSIYSRTSISGQSQSTKPVKYENTYKMVPDSEIQVHKVRDVMKDCLKEWLGGVDGYSPHVRNLTVGLTDEIKKRVKNLGYSRYKYVVTVTICQDAKQSMQMVSRCMWNKETDTFAEAVFKTGDICAIATLYAIYFE